MLDGKPNDWRDWDLPNRCIVASGQTGKNPRIYVWKIPRYSGETCLDKLVLATMLLGNQRLQVQPRRLAPLHAPEGAVNSTSCRNAI